jgi:hypothetical protein
MSDERVDLIVEHLRAIRSDISDFKTSMVEVQERLGSRAIRRHFSARQKKAGTHADAGRISARAAG